MKSPHAKSLNDFPLKAHFTFPFIHFFILCFFNAPNKTIYEMPMKNIYYIPHMRFFGAALCSDHLLCFMARTLFLWHFLPHDFALNAQVESAAS